MLTFIIVLLLSVILAVAGAWFLFKGMTVDKVKEQNRDKEKSIYLKKYKEVDLNNYRGLFLRVGLIISLGFTLWAFNWRENTGDGMDLGDLEIIEDIEIEPPPTKQEKPPPPPPPPPKLEIVEDEEILEDVPEIEDIEIDEETEIEIEEIPIEEEPAEPEIFTIVEQMPQFPGGDQEMMKYIYKNIKYPYVARDNNIEGLVVVTFVVEADGKITNAQVLRDIGGGCGEEAIRVVKSFPKWKPGKQRGKPVRVQFNLPVRFTLE